MALAHNLVVAIIELKEEAEALKNKGKPHLTNADIAERVLGNRKAESTVRRVWKHYKKNGHYNGSHPTSDGFINESTLESFIEKGDEALVKVSKQVRNLQRTNNHLRQQQRSSFDVEDSLNVLLSGIREACNSINKNNIKVQVNSSGGKRLTAEVLFSDLQIGKLMGDYSTPVAKRRIQEYARVAINKIKQHQNNGYVFDRIILAMLGDIIESDEKHHNSGRACDTSTAEQMKDAIESIFSFMVEPLALLGIPMDCICITGNHDWNGHGLNMFKSGRNQLSFPLYHSIKMISEAKGYGHVNFKIPDGVFHVDDIYGFKVLYEHGVGVGCSEAAMSKRRQQRSEQLREHITYFRMGDKHNVSRFNEDTLVVNGSFFGGDREGTEYSSICGYASDPSQIIIFHTPRNDARLSVYDSLIVQLIHVK